MFCLWILLFVDIGLQYVTPVGLGATLRHAKKTFFDASFQDGLVQQGGEESAHR